MTSEDGFLFLKELVGSFCHRYQSLQRRSRRKLVDIAHESLAPLGDYIVRMILNESFLSTASTVIEAAAPRFMFGGQNGSMENELGLKMTKTNLLSLPKWQLPSHHLLNPL